MCSVLVNYYIWEWRQRMPVWFSAKPKSIIWWNTCHKWLILFLITVLIKNIFCCSLFTSSRSSVIAGLVYFQYHLPVSYNLSVANQIFLSNRIHYMKYADSIVWYTCLYGRVQVKTVKTHTNPNPYLIRPDSDITERMLTIKGIS